MTVTYGFYDSLNGDRKYNAKQISEIFDGIIRDGVFMSIGDALAVSAGGGMSVIVGTGRAWFNHTWTYNDAPLILQVDQSEIALNRVDTVVLEVNSNIDVRANTIKIVKGVPSSEPVATELVRNEFVNQYPLAHIYVSAGATEITSADIENKIGSSDCPFVIGILVTPGDLLNLIEEHKAEKATKTAFGHVKIGDRISVADGVISADNQIISPTFGQATYNITLEKDKTATKNINIGTNKTRGIVIIRGNEGRALVSFTTIAQEAKGGTSGSYLTRRADSTVSGSIGYRISLRDAYISGTQLKLVFINNVAGTGEFSGSVYWEAW